MIDFDGSDVGNSGHGDGSHGHGGANLLQLGSALIGVGASWAVLQAARIRYAQMQDVKKSAAWAEYNQSPPSGELLSRIGSFFVNGELQIKQLMSHRIHGLPKGTALLLVESCLFKAAIEGNKDAIPLLSGVYILRDFEGILEAVEIIKKGPDAVIKRSCFILKAKDMIAKNCTVSDALIAAGCEMYPTIAKLDAAK